MRSDANDGPVSDGQTDAGSGRPRDREDASRSEVHNLCALALHQIVLRVGWVFKTESILMPAFLDMVGGTGWMRGCLPVFNRLGGSIPPWLFSRRLMLMPRKKWALVGSTAAMAAPLAIVSALCLLTGGAHPPWFPWFFLLLYGTFFVVTGVMQVAMHTLVGKLIRADRRGRLMTLSTTIGTPLAIVAAWWLLGDWLQRPGGGFSLIFAASSILFLVAAACACLVTESADTHRDESAGDVAYLIESWRACRADKDFRVVARVAGLFGVVLMLFPHYQAMGTEQLGLNLSDMVFWVVAQNAATGGFSLLAGPAADWRGNRIVLRVCIFGSALAPLVATGLSMVDPSIGRRLYWLVFVLVGLTPITLRLLTNYTLEIASQVDHPRFVSALGLCVALPVAILSPLVGWLVDLVGFRPVLLVGAALIMASGVLTLRLGEPRHGERGALAP